MTLSKIDEMIIAVDFDGTIVEHRYPAIGKEIPFAFETLRMLLKDGHDLILWTYRDGELLKEAVDYCEANGVTFYAINNSYPGEKYELNVSRKIHADLFIDDRSIGGLPGWGEIYHMINPNPLDPHQVDYKNRWTKSQERGLSNWLKRLFNW